MGFLITAKSEDTLTLHSFHDMQVFGILPLTNEAGALSYRGRCDVTQEGKELLTEYLGAPGLTLEAPTNSHVQGQPCVGSLTLDLSLWTALASFAFFANGALACCETKNAQKARSITGIYSKERLQEYENAQQNLLRN